MGVTHGLPETTYYNTAYWLVAVLYTKMAAKTKNQKLELEIERFRSQHNWEKALEVTKGPWPKSTSGIGEIY